MLAACVDKGHCQTNTYALMSILIPRSLKSGLRHNKSAAQHHDSVIKARRTLIGAAGSVNAGLTGSAQINHSGVRSAAHHDFGFRGSASPPAARRAPARNPRRCDPLIRQVIAIQPVK